ncbi:MAG: helix-turn-helix domain-containing protein [Hyphomicrobiaceae bacterium]
MVERLHVSDTTDGGQVDSTNISKAIDVQLGRRLKLRRTLLGLTQEQVASACELSFQQIHKYETGQSKISTRRLIQFSTVLDVPVAWFFEGLDSDDVTPQELDSVPLDKAIARLIATTKKIKSRRRIRQLVEFAKVLAEEED